MIEISRLDNGIYLSKWSATVTIEEVLTNTDRFIELVTENADNTYIMIIDLTDAKKLPVDVRNLMASANKDKRLLGYVAVKAPSVGEMLGKILGRLIHHHIEFAASVDEAIVKAREILNKSSSTFIT